MLASGTGRRRRGAGLEHGEPVLRRGDPGARLSSRRRPAHGNSRGAARGGAHGRASRAQPRLRRSSTTPGGGAPGPRAGVGWRRWHRPRLRPAATTATMASPRRRPPPRRSCLGRLKVLLGGLLGGLIGGRTDEPIGPSPGDLSEADGSVRRGWFLRVSERSAWSVFSGASERVGLGSVGEGRGGVGRSRRTFPIAAADKGGAQEQRDDGPCEDPRMSTPPRSSPADPQHPVGRGPTDHPYWVTGRLRGDYPCSRRVVTRSGAPT